jgi:hypothetical protein
MKAEGRAHALKEKAQREKREQKRGRREQRRKEKREQKPEPGSRPDGRSLNLDTVHAVEMAFLKDSETVCESPLCNVRFEQTGLAISPRRFCCDRCKQETSVIRRVRNLLDGLSDERVLEILRGMRW